MARVFSAVDIEDEKVLQNLERVRDRLNLGFSKIPREKMHLTLQFFEDVNENEISKVEKALRNVDKEPFSASIQGLGAFPSEDYIRVAWAGVNSHKIFELRKQARLHDIPSQDHDEFKPHITLLRVRDVSPGKKKKLKRILEDHKKENFGKVEVNQVKLFKSRLTGKGSEYEVLSTVDL